MQMIEISKLKPHPRNNEFFDDITGDKWRDFIQSIVRRGVVEGIVVTQDLVIVSGHQRVRACKEIGILEIPCRITHYPEQDERLKISKEDMIIEDLIATNILQRGIGNANPMKMARCILELERIYGIQNGGDRGNQFIKKEAELNNSTLPKTQTDIANQLGIDRTQYLNYKKLNDLIPELQSMVENEAIKATVAYKIWARLPHEEQEEFFNQLGKETIKKLTQKQTEEKINKIKQEKEELEQQTLQLQNQLQQEKNKEPKVVEIDNTDYSLANKLSKIEQELEDKKIEADRLQRKLDIATERAEIFEKNSDEYNSLKRQIELLTKEKDDISRAVTSGTELAGLIHKIEEFLKSELCPITYNRAILDMSNNETVMKNLLEIIETVEKWCGDMRKCLPKNQQNIIINVEGR